MQDYPKESGRGCFFAGLLFALVLGACGYRMLHKGTLTVEKAAPRKPDIGVWQQNKISPILILSESEAGIF